jgi:hypothetical protein
VATLTERLQLIVDATTSKAEARFQSLTGAAKETGRAAATTADQVRDAADKVAAARERETVAAGNLSVAQRRLDELRSTGRARASQLEAAEQKVATAQRAVQLASHQAARAQEDLDVTQRRAASSADDSARSTGRMSGAMTGLVASAASLVGVGLGGALRSAAEGFTEGARSAALFARSTNSSVEEASQFLGLVGSLGLDLNDLLEIQAEYAQKAAASADELEALGAQTKTNADGTINWTQSLVTFLEQLQKVPDATERNRLGFQFLGEEGYKQLSRLVASGVDVADALEQIGTPFSQQDLDAAADYDAALLRLDLAGSRLTQSLGRALVPVVAGLGEGLGDVLDIVEDVGPVLVVTTGAAIALGVTGFSPTAAAGARLAAITALVNRNLAVFRANAITAGAGATVLGAGMGVARAGAAGLAGMLGGPLGIALIALAGVWTLASNGADKFRQSAKDAAVELDQAEQRYGDMAVSVEELGQRLADEAGFWDGLAASRRGVSDIDLPGPDWLHDAFGQQGLLALGDQLEGGELAAQGFADEIDAAREELGAFGLQQETASQSAKDLNDLIAEGTTTGQGFADAVAAAADAQAREAQTSGLAEAAIDAYNAVTRDAVESTLALWEAQLAQRDGLRGLKGAIQDAA